MSTDRYSEGYGGTPKHRAAKFPNPFDDIATYFTPENIRDVFEWSEYIMMNFGTVRSASTRTARYFLTDIELETTESTQEQERMMKQLKTDMRIMAQLGEAGDNFMTYGNAFVSINPPIKRMAVCLSCSNMTAMSAVSDYTYLPREMRLSAKCRSRKCGGLQRKFRFQDIAIKDASKVKFVHWDPKDIVIDYNEVTQDSVYYWQIPSTFIKQVEEGSRLILETTPVAILQTIATMSSSKSSTHKKTTNNVLFRFTRDGIYHIKAPTLAGLEMNGWGIPSILANFKQIYYLQLLRRADESLAQDCIVPFRLISPPSGGGPGRTNDPLANASSANFLANASAMVKRHRQDPTSIQLSPYPLTYQAIGGEGRSLVPKDNMTMSTDTLLNDMGYPAQLWRGDLSLQAAPVALRIFEQTWSPLTDSYNYLTSWAITTISKMFSWGNVSGKLTPVTLADDMARSQIGLQGAAGMDISKTTAYKAWNLNYAEEQRRIIEEQKNNNRLQQEAAEEEQSAQAQAEAMGMAGGGGGGAPGPGGGGAPASPGDITEQAQQIAQQMLTEMPDSARRSELINMKQTNPTLHAMVKQEMANLRSSAASQGKEQVLAQGGPQ